MPIKSYKSYLRDTLLEADKETVLTRDKIKQTCGFVDYSAQGKKKKCSELLKKHNEYLEKKIRAVEGEKTKKLSDMEAAAKKELEHKNTDPDYQSILASTLNILPLLGEVSDEEIMERLLIFQDDPFAISALKAVVMPKDGTTRMRLMACIPDDTRSEKRERLIKTTNTVMRLLDQMKLRINEPVYNYNAVDDGEDIINRNISKMPVICSTLDYIDACNDDCTEYYPEKQVNTYEFGNPEDRELL